MAKKMVFMAAFLTVLAVAAPDNAKAAVTSKSPAVGLSAVGKQISPGVFVVAPGSIRNKRLILDAGGSGAAGIVICIGTMGAGGCKGIYISTQK